MNMHFPFLFIPFHSMNNEHALSLSFTYAFFEIEEPTLVRDSPGNLFKFVTQATFSSSE